jgi:hypothetical protein
MTSEEKIKTAIKFLEDTVGGMMFAFSHHKPGSKKVEKNRKELVDSLLESLKILRAARDLKIKAFPEREEIEIEGIRYSYVVFRDWGKNGFPVGTVFKILKRGDTLWVEKLKETDREGE